jgi:hypothetical protein
MARLAQSSAAVQSAGIICSKNVIQFEQFEGSNKQVSKVGMFVPKPDVCGMISID